LLASSGQFSTHFRCPAQKDPAHGRVFFQNSERGSIDLTLFSARRLLQKDGHGKLSPRLISLRHDRALKE
jgi:hypothetical protein